MLCLASVANTVPSGACDQGERDDAEMKCIHHTRTHAYMYMCILYNVCARDRGGNEEKGKKEDE